MNRDRTIRTVQCLVILSVPALLWAYSSGPEVHHTAVPGTGELSCNECHTGTALNAGGGFALMSASGTFNYNPGQAQTITLTVTDPQAKAFGFQVTARTAQDRTKQAGTFTPSMSQVVLCAPAELNSVESYRYGAACPPDRPLEFIEHALPVDSGIITLTWTPPATDVGPVEIYASANAANDDGRETGDHIYTAAIVLQSPGVPTQPAISPGGVITAGSFGARAGVAPGTWIEIYGNYFASGAREWARSDFHGGAAPTSLDDIGVTVHGKPAFIRFYAGGRMGVPDQINALVPDGVGTGPLEVVVTTGRGSSEPARVDASPELPGILAPFRSGGKVWAAAFQGSSIAGSPGFPAVKPGADITLYGIGFGPTDPAVAAGQTAAGLAAITGTVDMRFGDTPVGKPKYAGLSPGFAGLYQFNIVVPDVADGDYQLRVSLNGQDTGQVIFISVQR